jgi:hypothetical protein
MASPLPATTPPAARPPEGGRRAAPEPPVAPVSASALTLSVGSLDALSDTLTGSLAPSGALDASGTDNIPKRLGKYRILRELGEGGMSVVYLAVDDALDRQVAVKLLHRHLARDPEARARLTREARASARLRHPNIPETHDFSGADGGDGGRGYIVSEFVDGWSLAELLRRAPPTLPEIGVALVLRVAEALAHAHREGVVHRDVKPENILVGRDGVVKLTDFGIAHVVGGDAMTMTGTLLGSPLHMAPEQIRGERGVDARVDVWGFGTVLFMAVTGGRHAFEGGNPHVVMRRILDGEREDVRRLTPHVDSALAAILDGCLALDRERRPASMDDVAAALSGWLALRGVSEVEPVVRGYAADPAGFSRSFAKALADRLLRLAEDTGSHDAAVELLGRVLLLAPERRDAEAALRRRMRALRGRQTWRVLGLGGLGCVVAAAGLLALWPDADGRLEPAPQPLASLEPGARAVQDATPRPEVDVPTGPRDLEAEPGGASDVSKGLTGPGAGLDVTSAEPAATSTPAAPVAEVASRRAEATEAVRPPQALPRPPEARSVEARVTVYPPAVRVRVAGREITPGVPFRLPGGQVEVALTHPGCPTCGEDVRVLTIAPDPDGRWSTHLVFSRGGGEALAPARLSLRCEDPGGWVEGPAGARFACNEDHLVPVTSDRPTLIEFRAFDANGRQLTTRRFTLRPDAPIVWQL